MAESIEQETKEENGEEPEMVNPQIPKEKVERQKKENQGFKVRQDLDIPRAREASISLRRFTAVPTDSPQEGTLTAVDDGSNRQQVYIYLSGTHLLIGGTKTTVRAHKNGTDQTISASSTEKVTFSAKAGSHGFDTLGEFDLVTEQFTATQAGKYYIFFQGIVSLIDASAKVEIIKNSTAVAEYFFDISTNENVTLPVSSIIDLVSGDTIQIDITNNGSGSITLSGVKEETYLEILRV